MSSQGLSGAGIFIKIIAWTLLIKIVSFFSSRFLALFPFFAVQPYLKLKWLH